MEDDRVATAKVGSPKPCGKEIAIASWGGRTLVGRIGVSEEESEYEEYEEYEEVDPKWHYEIDLIIAADNKANLQRAWTAL